MCIDIVISSQEAYVAKKSANYLYSGSYYDLSTITRSININRHILDILKSTIFLINSRNFS